MTKTQVNESDSNTSIFDYTHRKAIIFLTIGLLLYFGLFKLFAYAENKKLAAEKAEIAELMKDELFKARIGYFSKPSHSKEESFIFYCQQLGLKKSQCEFYNDLNKKQATLNFK